MPLSSNISYTGADVAKLRSSLRRAVHSARSNEELDAVFEMISSVDENHPIMPEALALKARILKREEKLPEAEDAFKYAMELADRSVGELPAWARFEFGQVLEKRGKLDDALIAYNNVVEAFDPPHAGALAGALRIACRQDLDDEIESIDTTVAARAVIANPRDRLLVESLLDKMTRTSGKPAAIDFVCDIQNGHGFPLGSVLTTILSHCGRAELKKRFEQQLLKFGGEAPFLNISRAWASYITQVEVHAEDVPVVVGNENACIESWFGFIQPEPVQMPLDHLGDSLSEPLQSIGVNTAVLRQFIRDFLKVSDGNWAAILEKSSIVDPDARDACQAAEKECAYIDKVVEAGRLAVMDPLTGATVHAVDSVIVFGRTIYVFQGKELFFLVCGKPWSAALGFYIPRLNISIPFGRSPVGFLGKDLPNVLTALLRRYAARPSIDRLHVSHCDSSRRPVVMSVGHTENFAHHLWNFYSAIERLCVKRTVGQLAAISFSGTEFFGPLDEIFPELKAVKFIRSRRMNVIDGMALGEADGLIVPSGGFYISDSLSRRIITYAASTSKKAARSRNPVVEPADVDIPKSSPVVWMAFRLRDKSWEEQEAGSTQIIKRVAEQFQDAVFLLDGFSYPVGEDFISHQWEDVVDSLYLMGERIKAAAGVTNTIVNMVGNTLRESVLWADKTTVYLAPYGTTQHKVGWFTGAPGVVYVPANFEPRNVVRSPGSSASELGTSPEFIYASAVSPGEKRGFNRNREKFFNVSLDPEDIAARLIRLIACSRPQA